MQIDYYVSEEEGRAVSWAIVEGDALTLGDFLTNEELSRESNEQTQERWETEMQLVSWCDDIAQPLPCPWRLAGEDEIARIHASQSKRLSGLL